MLKNYEKNLNEIKINIKDIGNSLIKTNILILNALDKNKIDILKNAKKQLKNTEDKINNIDNISIKLLALHSPEAKDLKEIIAYIKIANELSRANSNTKKFINGINNMYEYFNIDILNKYTIPMQKFSIKTTENAIAMINCKDTNKLKKYFEAVLIFQNKTNDLYSITEENLAKEAKHIQNFITFQSLLHTLRKSEKIADRFVSVATLLIYANLGKEINQL